MQEQARQEIDADKRTALLAEAKKWDEGGAYRVALHTAIGGLAGGTSGALGAGATAAAAPLLNELQDNIAKGLKEAGANDSLAKVAGQLIAGGTAAGIGAAAGGGIGAVTGFNADANNRQLHPSEQQKAKDLYAQARKQGLPYTLADIEDALRTANYKGETITTNIVVNPNAPAGVNDKSATDMFTGEKEDLMTGNTTNATKPWIEGANGTQVQNFGSGGIKAPTADLVGFIRSNSSDYSWTPTSVAQPPVNPNAGMVWTSNGFVPASSGVGGDTRYATLSANGMTFRIPVADCPAGGCANLAPIAWATTNPEDHKTLVAYAAALDQDAKRAVAYGAGTPIMVGGMVLGGVPVAGQALMGVAIGGGVNAAAQYQFNNGEVKPSEVIMGGVTGGLTMGRSLIPTVLINTGGAMTTAAFENENIGASMVGTAVGSALGWKVGNLTQSIVGQVIQRTTTGFTEGWVNMPFAISAPVPVSSWSTVWGASVGAGVQEVVGDQLKNKIKELP